MVLTIPTFNDAWLSRLLPIAVPALIGTSFPLTVASYAVAVMVGVMSIRPIGNMLSPNQIMNTNYNPLHLVGTYGAFGSITRARYEIVIEGTDESAITPATAWREYSFKGKPGDVTQRPPQIAPYHLRLDWLMWFAAMGSYSQHPWFVHFVEKLLVNDPGTLSLIRKNPFPDRPPHYVRAELYEYHFTTPAERRKTGEWWTRTWVGHYFPTVSLDTPGFRRVLEQAGWLPS